jgi:hypothetical protein
MRLDEPFSNSLVSAFIADAAARVKRQNVSNQLARLTTEVVSTVAGIVDCEPLRQTPTEGIAGYNVGTTGAV